MADKLTKRDAMRLLLAVPVTAQLGLPDQAQAAVDVQWQCLMFDVFEHIFTIDLVNAPTAEAAFEQGCELYSDEVCVAVCRSDGVGGMLLRNDDD